MIRIAGTEIRIPPIRLGPLPELRPMPVVGPIGVRALEFGRALPDSRLVDRLVRARIWVGLLAVLLFGLVAINVSMLKLNAESGRNAESVRKLEIRNTQLHAKVSRLASGERIQRVAAGMGFKLPDPDQVQYVSAQAGDGRRAAKAIRMAPLVATAPALQGQVVAPDPAPQDAAKDEEGSTATGTTGATGPTGTTQEDTGTAGETPTTATGQPQSGTQPPPTNQRQPTSTQGTGGMGPGPGG